MFSFLFPIKRNTGALDKWLILDLGQGMCKLSLERLVIPEARKISNTPGVVTKDYKIQLEKAPIGQRWDHLSIEKNNDGKELKHIKDIKIHCS